jgi:hypothetical protein
MTATISGSPTHAANLFAGWVIAAAASFSFDLVI